MTVQNLIIEGDTVRLVEIYGDSRMGRELIALFSRHPNVKFNKLALCHVTDCRKLDKERALHKMVETGLVDESSLNGTTLYSLKVDEEKRCQVIKLGNLGWDEWWSMVKRPESGRTSNLDVHY